MIGPRGPVFVIPSCVAGLSETRKGRLVWLRIRNSRHFMLVNGPVSTVRERLQMLPSAHPHDKLRLLVKTRSGAVSWISLEMSQVVFIDYARSPGWCELKTLTDISTLLVFGTPSEILRLGKSPDVRGTETNEE